MGKQSKFIMTDEQKRKIEPRDEIEIWDDLVFRGYETDYLISTCGRIRYKKKYTSINTRIKNELISLFRTKRGYILANISILGLYFQPLVHRLVAHTFIKIPKKYITAGYTEDELEVNHKNGLIFDNYVGNLEWCTQEENIKHFYATHMMRSLLADKQLNLSSKKAHDISVDFVVGLSDDDIFNKYGISVEYIKNLLSNKTYSEFSNYGNIIPISISEIGNDIISKKEVTRKKAKDITSLIDDRLQKLEKSSNQKKKLEKLVKNICMDLENGLNDIEISEKYNINKWRVRDIRRGRVFENITSQYSYDKSPMITYLSEDVAHKICKDLESGMKNQDIATKYNTSSATVKRVKKGKLFPDISSQYNIKRRIYTSPLTEDQVHSICKDMENGLRNYEIMEKYNISRSVASKIRNRSAYSNITNAYNY